MTAELAATAASRSDDLLARVADLDVYQRQRVLGWLCSWAARTDEGYEFALVGIAAAKVVS